MALKRPVVIYGWVVAKRKRFGKQNFEFPRDSKKNQNFLKLVIAQFTQIRSIPLGNKREIHTMKFAIAPLNP
jgi:hypothetical protein